MVSTNDLSATTNIGKIVKLDAANAPDHIVLATAAADVPLGVLVDAPGVGQTGTVRLRQADGTSFVQLGGTVAVGNALTANASGLAVAATQALAGAQPTSQIFGYALQAGVSGSIIEIQPSGIIY